MTALTAADRFWRGVARWIDRPVLAAVASQPFLRVLFAFSARMGSALPPGTTPIRDRHGALWITPRGVARDAPVLMYLHGGGFTIGGPRTHAALAGHLAAHAGMRACLPAYRLAPEHPAPAAREDAIAAYEHLIEAGTPPAAIAGDSAGGNLALLVAMHARDAGLPQPKALTLIAPAADLTGDIAARFAAAPDEILIPPAWPRRIRAAYLPGVDPADPTVSPLSGDLTGLPPTLIHAGAEEALALEARRLADRMDTAELKLWPGLPHVWHLHAGRAPAADRALAELGAFLKARIS